MSAPGIPWTDGVVVDTDGAATLLLDGTSVLGWRLGPVVTVDSTSTEVVATGSTTEVDELRYAFAAGAVRLDLRHSLDQTWAIRLAISNPTDAVVQLADVALLLSCGAGWRGWALRAGAEASVAVLPAERRRPVVGFILLQGELRGSRDLLALPDLVLQPGGQYVVRLRGETYPDVQHFAVGRHDLLPPTSWVEAGELVRIEHQDQAVVGVPGGDADNPAAFVNVAELEGAVELEGDGGQVSRLQLVGPRGMTDVTVGFAPSLDQVVAGLVALGEQTWPSTRQGLRLAEPADGLVVQRFLAGGGSTGASHEVWSEALEGLCARVSPESSLLAVALLARQSVLIGDPDLAERAAAGIAVLAGEPGAAVVAAHVLAVGLVTGGADSRVGAVASTAGGSAVADVQAWGAQFGFGLRGDRLGDPDLVGDARAVALATMQLALDPPRPRGWFCGFAELVQRQRRRLLGETYGNPSATEAVAWLTLAD